MRLGLIKYKGPRKGSFTVRKGGVIRVWGLRQTGNVRNKRWLPESEALAYDKLPHFALIRWGTDKKPTKFRRAPGSMPAPAPQAVPVAQVLHQMAEQEAQELELAVLGNEAEGKYIFVMSSTGLVHVPSCSIAKKIVVPVGFYTAEDAAADPKFKKWHRCVG